MKINPFVMPESIQSTVDEIMARNRALFGGWSMEADGDGGDAGDGDQGGNGGDDGAGDGDDAAAAALGDAGKQALDRMKAEREEAKRRAKAAEAELEKLRNASKSEQEKAIDAARKEGESEATKRANDRLIRAEAKVLAATAKFRDPSDVIAQLGSSLAEIEVDDNGEVDGKALKALVDGLAKSKPYLIDAGDGAGSASDAGIGTTGSGGRTTTATPGLGRLRVAYEQSATK